MADSTQKDCQQPVRQKCSALIRLFAERLVDDYIAEKKQLTSSPYESRFIRPIQHR
jgi:hypothetical protein